MIPPAVDQVSQPSLWESNLSQFVFLAIDCPVDVLDLAAPRCLDSLRLTLNIGSEFRPQHATFHPALKVPNVALLVNIDLEPLAENNEVADVDVGNIDLDVVCD